MTGDRAAERPISFIPVRPRSLFFFFFSLCRSVRLESHRSIQASRYKRTGHVLLKPNSVFKCSVLSQSQQFHEKQCGHSLSFKRAAWNALCDSSRIVPAQRPWNVLLNPFFLHLRLAPADLICSRQTGRLWYRNFGFGYFGTFGENFGFRFFWEMS